MNSFSLSRDFKNLLWGQTFWLNILRAFCAGIVWAIVAFVMLLKDPDRFNGPNPLIFPLLAVVMYPFFLVIFLIFGKVVTLITGGAGELAAAIMMFMAGLAVAVGDPLVFMLHRIKPALVPLEKYPFLCPAFFIAVLKPIHPPIDG